MDPAQITAEIRGLEAEMRDLIADHFVDTAGDLAKQHPAYACAYQVMSTWVKLVDLDVRSRQPGGRVTAAILRRGSEAIEACEEAVSLTMRLGLVGRAPEPEHRPDSGRPVLSGQDQRVA